MSKCYVLVLILLAGCTTASRTTTVEGIGCEELKVRVERETTDVKTGI